MARITSKYQVTVPRVIADAYGLTPGDEIDWQAAGEVIRVVVRRPSVSATHRLSPVRAFDQATARQGARRKALRGASPRVRGWTREDLYTRGRAR